VGTAATEGKTGAAGAAGIPAIQEALRAAGLDGWLFYDFRGNDPLAYSILGMPAGKHRTRRWFYFVPASGEPTKIVHAIETAALDSLPGRKIVYLPWGKLEAAVRETLAGRKRIAMQYSPGNAIPYLSRVDAGTIELVRSAGAEVVSSADLTQQFEATLSEAAYKSHAEAAELLGRIVLEGFAEIGRRLRHGKPTTETDIQRYLLDCFAEHDLVSAHPPNVSADANSADPHYDPQPKTAARITKDTFVLIDAWCKFKKPGSIYADITWVGYVGPEVPPEHEKIFRIVAAARDAAIDFVQKAQAEGRPVRGCDADDACRKVIADAGFAERFIHRTGHNIGENTHGNGANIDNLETRDERRLIPRTLFSVEPGIYLPGKFGVRSEVNVFLPDEKSAVVTGLPAQTEIILVG
jgi:Xaa-Pro aminopeptidase